MSKAVAVAVDDSIPVIENKQKAAGPIDQDQEVKRALQCNANQPNTGVTVAGPQKQVGSLVIVER